MKAIISTTYDDKYFFFLPIVSFLWNKMKVAVECFTPMPLPEHFKKIDLVRNAFASNALKVRVNYFDCPEHKKATYAQCSRLFGSCLTLPDDEIIVVSDIDMANFKLPPYGGDITIFGFDLVPHGQYPMCYATGRVSDWRSVMETSGKTLQQCLDELLGGIECDNMRGNYWAKDQETLWDNTCDRAVHIPRARPGTQFASNRVDRDDSFWRDRLNHDVIDAHLWRPGYEDENFEKIIELIQFFYPNDDLTWMREYQQQYKALI
jgi:hypothetical protein